MRGPARSGGRLDCRCPPSRRRVAPTGAGRPCRTSCRSVRGSAAASPWWPASFPAAQWSLRVRSTRNHAPLRSTGDRDRYWSARSVAPARAPDPPGSCRAAACCRPESRTSRRTARSAGPSSAAPADHRPTPRGRCPPKPGWPNTRRPEMRSRLPRKAPPTPRCRIATMPRRRMRALPATERRPCACNNRQGPGPAHPSPGPR